MRQETKHSGTVQRIVQRAALTARDVARLAAQRIKRDSRLRQRRPPAPRPTPGHEPARTPLGPRPT